MLHNYVYLNIINVVFLKRLKTYKIIDPYNILSVYYKINLSCNGALYKVIVKDYSFQYGRVLFRIVNK